MPKYYFHVRKDGVVEQDPEGAEFATIDQAHAEATQAAREIVAEMIVAGAVVDGHTFVIANEDGAVVSEIPFKSVLRLE
ncbi:hypothetical protein SAMN02982989_0664 [Xaviernesmea oryzae]|uniref:DUF6894 domain-containing protein n=1 Tax=Xaviernesmea oryzae TaxID=464029 RepID=A0A1X7FTV0_9HYPH|nr:hypothetical protein [Xaviernesmea oryzae]SMF57974.1 hypothetical protein SAMN02982989_0664 [Xaviernesmea oryzae]